MARIFDYKFVIILGLSLIVYFLYREVEHLNYRVKALECDSNNMNVEKIDNVMEEIPLPPRQDIEIVLVNNDNMVEEYSNEIHNSTSTSSSEEINIYSHDILNTNTNENDSIGIESIINMAQDENVVNTNDIIDQIISAKNSPVSPKEDIVVLESKENNLENDLENDLGNLMKLKLTELQYMATNMGINITVGDTKKKKTKSELANEIFNKK